MNLQNTVRLATFCVCGILSICSVQAQVVQQPVIRNFSYTGGAWVPDSGTGFLAGNQSARSNSTSRGIGPYAPRAISSSRVGSRISVSATIIDLDALDEALLNQPIASSSSSVLAGGAGGQGTNGAASDPQSSSSSPSRLAGLSRKIVTTTGPLAGSRSVQTRDSNAYRRALGGHYSGARAPTTGGQLEDDVRYYLTEGLKAETAGSIIAARVFYRMAMESMTPEMLARYKRVLERRKQEASDSKKANSPNAVSF